MKLPYEPILVCCFWDTPQENRCLAWLVLPDAAWHRFGFLTANLSSTRREAAALRPASPSFQDWGLCLLSHSLQFRYGAALWVAAWPG